MSKHTTGPWTHKRYERRNQNLSYVQAADESMAAAFVKPEDAALIAAAPELLEAAIAALACIEKHVSATTFAPRDLLRAAIAKAEGR